MDLFARSGASMCSKIRMPNGSSNGKRTTAAGGQGAEEALKCK